ncbi:HpcH/HpaI aldolase/citrate lyase family protein [Nocardioides alcanivorans]|uniref:HpcH/HpaI aldolase/citrate lyase family protein n=1 Tax=Nocardioides alcanivorans TaxID=2897352 RepID=UPI001F2FE980|nr:aldolase/citrate lyase family protein [Nocardioides alcanivorans]
MTVEVAQLPRTYLYVPGNAHALVGKALRSGADALILDLEDAVPLAEKDAALAAVVGWLRELPADGDVELWVRLNPGERRVGEVTALAGLPALRGLALAKTESAAEVTEVADLLASLGDTDTVLMPLLESAAGVLAAQMVATAPRVHRLQIGEVDLAGDAGLEPGADDAELAWMRAMVVLASAASRDPPTAGAGLGDHPRRGGVPRVDATSAPPGFRRTLLHPPDAGAAHARGLHPDLRRGGTSP